MSAEPDALAVVNQLRDLAADPMNRRAIVQDQGCLPGLILFLDHPNPQVVYSALLVSCATDRRTQKCVSLLSSSAAVTPSVRMLNCIPGFRPGPLFHPAVVSLTLIGCCSQAIRYLAECRANREKLKGELGMMLSLQNVVQK